MTKREIVKLALAGQRPPYVPWHCDFTVEPKAELAAHFGTDDIDTAIGNHLLQLSNPVGFYEPIGGERYRDLFGVVWDRSVDKDIGIVEGNVLPEPTLDGLQLPDPHDPRFFADIPAKLERYPDRFRVFCIGFSLFERAWTLRGMENLMLDFYENPDFVHELLGALAEFNIALAHKALSDYDIDGIYFGDDWGQQQGLIMGPGLWRKFLKPHLARMYAVAKDAGKYQFIHSCGDVDELFDDLIEIGLDCFNPFQPEVMDVQELLPRYRGRLAFHGGLSTQQTLPYGTTDDVRRESRRLLELGRDGSYIFAPAHAVESDAPLQNLLAFIDELHAQDGYHHPTTELAKDTTYAQPHT